MSADEPNYGGHSFGNISVSGSARVHNGDLYGDQINNNSIVYVFGAQQHGDADRIGLSTCLHGTSTLIDHLHGELGQYVGRTPEPPILAKNFYDDLGTCQNSLKSLSSCFESTVYSPAQASRISASQLIASFTTGVQLLDELQESLKPLLRITANDEAWDADSTGLGQLRQRLQWQQLTWSLQSRLARLDPMESAHGLSLELEQRLDTHIRSNTALERRMETMELQMRQVQRELETAAITRHPEDVSRLPTFQLKPREFEDILEQSGPYRRNADREEMMSFSTSVPRASILSQFTDISMADVSILSFIALPLYASELNHSEWYTHTHNQPSIAEVANTSVASTVKLPPMNTYIAGSGLESQPVSLGIEPIKSNASDEPERATENTSLLPTRPRRTQKQRGMKLRKIAIVGSRGVQKSSITVQFVDGHYVESYYPTIENTFSKVIKYKGQEFATEIIDTAGQDEYSILNSQHFIGIHGYMIVYSVGSRQSFDMAQIIRDKILNHLGVKEVPIMLVANHSELSIHKRQVTFVEGQKLASELRCAFTEVSARYNENVGEAFVGLIAEIERMATIDAGPLLENRCALM